MLFSDIRKTEHYEQVHESDVPWSEVMAVIFSASKKMRKKGDKIEIKTDRYYVLCEVKNQTLWEINAKRRR